MAVHEGDREFDTHLSRFVFPDGRVLEETSRMKVWSFAAWTSLLARSRFSLNAAYANDTFLPLPVAPVLDGLHVFWQQLVRAT